MTTLPLTAALAVAAVLGALHTLAYTATGAWPLQLAAAAGLYALLAGARPLRAAALGWAFGTAWLAAGTWWLFISMHKYGGLPAPLAALAVAALAAALSLYLAAAAAAFAQWRSRRALPDAALFAALWLAAELARGQWFTGFPWVAAGYAHVDAPLAALAPWVGVYGIGAAAAALAATAVHGWLPASRCPSSPGPGPGPGGPARARRHIEPWAGTVLAAAVLAGLALAGPAQFTRSAGTLPVTLVQTNIAQDEKFAAERMPEALAWLAHTLQSASTPLVVAPETAVPLLPDQLAELAPGWWPAVQAHFGAPGRAALVGVPLGSWEAGYTNSVVALSAGPAYRYDKHHLVPFGEFIPRGFRWFTELMHIPLGDFSRGRVDAAPFAFAGQRIAPNICYEDLFGEELAVRFADAAAAPTVLVNVSNIAWFGDTVAVPQHLHISRMRSLELQRPMLRATNTGATVAIDHTGRVVAGLPPFTRGTLKATVDGRDGVTPFARWAGAFGLWPLWLAAAAIVLAVRVSRAPAGAP